MKLLVYYLSIVIIFFSCREPGLVTVGPLTGKTMGTTYHITFIGIDNIKGKEIDIQNGVDSILLKVNQSMSTYIDTSLISTFNQSAGLEKVLVDDHFAQVFMQSKEVYNRSGGAFDPSIMPLVNYWGFGFEKLKNNTVDSTSIDSLLELIGFNQFTLVPSKSAYYVSKSLGDAMLDFSAIAKGYGVDAVASFMDSKGFENYMIEIGGEVRCRGKNSRNDYWTIGINKPSEDLKQAMQFQDRFSLNDLAMATSGNYRNYRVVDGKKLVHTINPKTGYPEVSNLLSVTVFAMDCMTADAYATACMVLGLQNGRKLIESNEDLEAYFIYVDKDSEFATTMTAGAEAILLSSSK